VFTHSTDPLEDDDWLKTLEKMLTIVQCDDREKVLYSSGRLQDIAGAWWDAYVAAHATPDAITWQEFTTSFRSHHIPAGLMKLKKKEFLSLKQGGMSVAEFRNKTGSSLLCCLAMHLRMLLMMGRQEFLALLFRYAPKDVADDGKTGAIHEGISWTTSVPAYVSLLCIISAVDGQGYLLGVKAQRVGRSEEEGHYLYAVWEQQSPPFHSTTEDNTPCWRFRWYLWAESVST
jgi:hypothetical protein